MAANMNAEPRKVKMRNFIAEYSRRPVPQTEMRKNMGTSSSSQKMKKRMRSSETKTPMTAACSARSHMKYSRVRVSTRHETRTAATPRMPFSRTSGALRPSTPIRYWTSNAAIQSARWTN